MRAHFSLRWLFGVVSFLAIGCGLLTYASPILSKLTATFTVLALLSAVPAAIYHAGERRAFWAGFVLFGGAYLWMVCGTWLSHDGSTAFRERLVTTDLLTRCYELLPSTQSPASANSTSTAIAWLSYQASPVFNRNTGQPITMPGSGYPLSGTAAVVTATVDRADFLTTGHSLFAILFALLGGAVTRRCASRASASSKGASLQG
jgi:hypothetical protein